MSLKKQIEDKLNEALKAKDKNTYPTLRLVVSAIKDAEIAGRTKGQKEMLDSDITAILKKMIKQRKESAEIYKESDRADLEKKENDEIEIIEQYMPSQINDDEIDKLISEIIDETGSSNIKDMGRVMTILKEKYSGQMDFGKASLIVKEKLNS